MRKVLLVIILALSFFLVLPARAGFGVSPAYLINDHAVPGASFSQQVIISRSDPDLDMVVSAQLPVGMEKWITINPAPPFSVPKGVAQFPIEVKIDVPPNADYEWREGVLAFNATAVAKGGTNAISEGAGVKVEINISNQQYYDFNVTKVSMEPMETGWPVKLDVRIKNLGNQRARPNKVKLDIYDDYHNNLLASQEITGLDYVDPFAEKTIVASEQADLKPGQYWAEYEIYKKGELAVKSKLRFDVLPAWALGHKPLWLAIKDFIFGSPLRLIGCTAGATLFLTLLILLPIILLLRRKKNTYRINFLPILLALAVGVALLFAVPARAANVDTSVTVQGGGAVCGNSVVESGETCDDGGQNGSCGHCNATCDGQMPACGGGGTTDNPPSIYNVASSTAITTASVSWTASDDHQLSSGSFVYGTSLNYDRVVQLNITAGTTSGSFKVDLSGLTENIVYYFKISVTDDGGHTVENTGSFSTATPLPPPPDTTPPVISAISVQAGMTTATVNWSTDEPADSRVDFGLTAAYGSSAADGALILSHSLDLSGLLPNTTYHYRLRSADALGNAASTGDATFTTLSDHNPPPNVSNLTLTVNGNSFVLNWTNPTLAAVPDFAGVKVVRKVGAPSANVSDGTVVYTGTGENLIDTNVSASVNYYYTVFVFDTSDNYSSGDYKNGMIVPPPPPPPPTPTSTTSTPPPPPPGNGPPTSTPSTTPPYQPPTSTVPTFAKLTLDKVKFWTGNGQIQIYPAGDTLSLLAGSAASAALAKNVLPATPVKIDLRVGSDTYNMVYDSVSHSYTAGFIFPAANQTAQAFIEIDYGAGQVDSLGFNLKGLAYGEVWGDGRKQAYANVALYSAGGQLLPVETYGQANPYLTGANGYYGWVVPNGQYYISATKDNFLDRQTPVFTVSNNVVNQAINLIVKPKPVLVTIKPGAPIVQNVANVAKSIVEQAATAAQVVTEKIGDAGQVIQQVSNNPEVKQVAPRAAIGAILIGAIPLITWVDFLPFLRLLFLQPLMLLGWRKRRNWGVVYNALNKLPVDLAVVRLVNTEINRIVQSKVTDTQGRYLFVADPGRYRIEVKKNKFVFPSALLGAVKDDGRFIDVYHGEVIEVKENKTTITANIPLDPVGEYKRPARLVWQKIGRLAQNGLAWGGMAVTAISLYINPKWYVALLLGVHVSLFFLFKKLATPPKPKSWGIVYDSRKKVPISRVVARLFNAKLNKLVATQVTDNDGRYSFLAGNGMYFVTYDRQGYAPFKTAAIDLTGKSAETIAMDVALKAS